MKVELRTRLSDEDVRFYDIDCFSGVPTQRRSRQDGCGTGSAAAMSVAFFKNGPKVHEPARSTGCTDLEIYLQRMKE
jgi:hypothetical protein